MNDVEREAARYTRKKRGKTRYFIGLFLVLLALYLWKGSGSAQEVTIDVGEKVAAAEIGEVPVELEIVDTSVHYTVAEGDIPADVFSTHGKFDANDTAGLLAAGEDIYDFTKIKIGRDLIFSFDDAEDTRATRMVYDSGTEFEVVAERSGDDFTVEKKRIVYDISEEVVDVTINNSLYLDALEAGIEEATIINVGSVFAFSIDFATEVREGDTLMMLYQRRSRDGNDATNGDVLAATYDNAGEKYQVYYFPGDGENEGGYYDEEGRALERQFLKAPMDFFRITSGYTGRRFHPVIKKYTAHYQIDYAAPTGTPVYATGRGTVTSAGWENGWGYIVRVRHDNGYTTHYAHLSRFAKGIRSGTKVAQSETIGYVGSTGWSTGPHLDYGMRLNGNPVNPLKLDLPKGEPLDAAAMALFEDVKKGYDEKLEGKE